jgi:hypothetical protein
LGSRGFLDLELKEEKGRDVKEATVAYEAKFRRIAS